MLGGSGRLAGPCAESGQLLSKVLNMRAHIYIIALLLFLTLVAYFLLRFA